MLYHKVKIYITLQRYGKIFRLPTRNGLFDVFFMNVRNGRRDFGVEKEKEDIL